MKKVNPTDRAYFIASKDNPLPDSIFSNSKLGLLRLFQEVKTICNIARDKNDCSDITGKTLSDRIFEDIYDREDFSQVNDLLAKNDKHVFSCRLSDILPE